MNHDTPLHIFVCEWCGMLSEPSTEATPPETWYEGEIHVHHHGWGSGGDEGYFCSAEHRDLWVEETLAKIREREAATHDTGTTD